MFAASFGEHQLVNLPETAFVGEGLASRRERAACAHHSTHVGAESGIFEEAEGGVETSELEEPLGQGWLEIQHVYYFVA